MKMNKYYRILRLYTWLDEGRYFNITQIATDFDVDIRTIRRDLSDINAFLAEEMIETGYARSIVFDRKENCYRIA